MNSAQSQPSTEAGPNSPPSPDAQHSGGGALDLDALEKVAREAALSAEERRALGTGPYAQFLNTFPPDTVLSSLSRLRAAEEKAAGFADVALGNAVEISRLVGTIGTAKCGPKADIEELRLVAERIERLFDNASKVAATGAFGEQTATECARAADAIRTVIVEVDRYRNALAREKPADDLPPPPAEKPE